jgi:hypothetical protein
MGAAQFGAAGSAAAAKSKLLGFMRERIEIGAPGEFAECAKTSASLSGPLRRQPSAEARPFVHPSPAQRHSPNGLGAKPGWACIEVTRSVQFLIAAAH